MELQEIAVSKLDPSPLNPRRTFSPEKLAELQSSIAAQGMIEPIVARKKGQRFEIVCGERRHRAASALKLTTVPVVVRKLSDIAALELALVENIQDEDLHPLDEAAAYEALLKAPGVTLESVSARVGRSASHIYRRLQFLKLTSPVRMAFARDAITVRHAERLTRVPASEQAEALETCFATLFASEQLEPGPVRHLDEWIARHVKEQLNNDAIVHVFPELIEQAGGDHPEDAILEMVGLSESHHAGSDLGDRKHGLLNAGRWDEIRSDGDRCEHARNGAVLHGGKLRVIECCIQKGCKKHRPLRPKPSAAAAKKTAEQRRVDERRKGEEVRAAWDRNKPKLLEAFVAHVKGAEVTPALVEAFSGYLLKTTKALIGKVTPENMGQAMSIAVMLDGRCYDVASFKRGAKRFGFNTTKELRAIEAARKKEIKARLHKAAKELGRKAAKRRTRKAAKKAKA